MALVLQEKISFMENKNSDIEIIKNIVNSTPNDSELGQKMRKFFRDKKKNIDKKRKDD
jgi:hypothetical protein